jgi:predicted RNase H-like HicB family nuclease
MNESDRYAKIVEWSEEDHCFVGTAPGLVFGGCHGSDENAVREDLDRIIDEAIALYAQDGRPLPA